MRARLAEGNPSFAHHHATSLTNLATILARLGRPKPARAAAQESLDVHRRPAETDPVAAAPGVAMASRVLDTIGP
ncbi:tetratricopeptide repeat protein [Asanoa sp. NPDC050611]|uniref:tetratricopeptide repeat protein n=1 Tax=Asanoa sp. NPDC050611 TaxID=3157098 RepID=UPI0033CC3BF3